MCFKAQSSLFNEGLTCFDNTLTEDECADLYQVALFGGVVEDAQLMKNIYGPHRETMKELLDIQRLNSELQGTNDDEEEVPEEETEEDDTVAVEAEDDEDDEILNLATYN